MGGFDLASGNFKDAYAALIAALEERHALQQILGLVIPWRMVPCSLLMPIDGIL